MKRFENDFPLDPSILYLNHAAVAPWPRRTAEAVKNFAEENLTRGATDYPNWMRTEKLLRQQFKDLINAPSAEDIALVKNTSEALSFVAAGIDWQSGDNIVSSNEEFPSNRQPWQALANQGVEFREADLHADISPEDALFGLVDDKTRLITTSSIQFSTGIRLDINRIGQFCRERDILFCVDAIQSIGAVQFDVQACQADFVMGDGHKWMLGPEGLAVFYSRPAARDQLKLTQFGWHMAENPGDYSNGPWQPARSARRFECGSPNMLGIHALSASLSLLLEIGMDEIEKAVLDNSRYMLERIEQSENLQALTGNTAERLSGIVVFKHQKLNNIALFDKLKSENIVCAQRGGGIRFSPHFYTARDVIDRALDISDRRA